MRKSFSYRLFTLICVFTFFCLLAIGSRNDSSSSSFTTKQVGEKAEITVYSIGCYEKSDAEDVVRMLNHYDGDDTYFNNLVLDGKAIILKEGVTVTIVDKELGYLKVSAPAGTVWIPTDCVK